MLKSLSDSTDTNSKERHMKLTANKKSMAKSQSETKRESLVLRETNIHDPTQTARPPVADAENSSHCSEKECSLPQRAVIKMVRQLASKKRDFLKLKKGLIAQQNTLLEQYAALKELENKVGDPVDEKLGEVRILSVSNWPAHDLLLLIRDDLHMPLDSKIGSIFAPQVLQHLHAQLTPIPEEVLEFGAEILARRLDVLSLLRGKNSRDRPSYQALLDCCGLGMNITGEYITYLGFADDIVVMAETMDDLGTMLDDHSRATQQNLEFKSKFTELDLDTVRLHKLVTGTVENIKAKINYSLELAKMPWLDREAIVKKMERLQKENIVLSHRIEELSKEESYEKDNYSTDSNVSPCRQLMEDELKNERAARNALKEVVLSAENMLRVARARIATLEKTLKEIRTELEVTRRKHKELEQLYRHRESSYDLRSKRLAESSKTGEMAIEALSRQRDALEIRVKELREQMEKIEKGADCRDAELRSKIESLQAKLLDQEKKKEAAEAKVLVMEDRVKCLEDELDNLRRHSSKLAETERRRCLEYIPMHENEPTERETEIWKELQSTRRALCRTEEQLRQSRADKDDFLSSIAKIAAVGADNIHEQMSAVLLQKELKITQMQQTIETQKENEKIMEQSIAQYENQLATLRLEIRRLKNYDCYMKEIPYQELETELLELQMQLETTQREHSTLENAAATSALMLERHEKAADIFARVTKARRDIFAILNRSSDPPPVDEVTQAEASHSLSTQCAKAADTWSALYAERTRITRLERAVLSLSLQLEREGRVRTQLERRRALLEREILRAHKQAAQCMSGELPPPFNFPGKVW